MALRMVVDDKIRNWRKRGPLARWLEEQGEHSIYRVMASTGVKTRQGVYAWCEGVSKPTWDKMQAVEELTGITPYQWWEWWASQPGLRPSALPHKRGRPRKP